MSQICQESSKPTKAPCGKVPTRKEDPKSTDTTKSEFQELKAAVEALKTEVNARSGTASQSKQGRGNRWRGGRGPGRREVRPRPPKSSKCLERGEQWCNHCFKCGSDNHYATGCCYAESSGQRPLNGSWLLVWDQK